MPAAEASPSQRWFDQYCRNLRLQFAGRSCAGAACLLLAFLLLQSTPLPSGQQLTLSFEQTPKVIREVRATHPKLNMVTFKYEENRTHRELMAIARERSREYQLVVANRGEEFIEYGDQVAWLVENNKSEEQVISKPAIAKAVLERVANWL